MGDKPSRQLAPRDNKGFFHDLSLRIRLIARLIADRRVNVLLKLLPIATLFYLIIPDTLPGPLDDAAIIWLGTTLFVELCPRHVVQEHMDAMTSVIDAEWRDVGEVEDHKPEVPDESG